MDGLGAPQRLAFIAVVAALELLLATSAKSQSTELPFDIGERLRYRVSVKGIGNVGEGEMSVGGPVDIRGIATLVLTSEVHAKIGPVARSERTESWIDPIRFTALRYHKHTRNSLARDHEQRVELFPEDQRWEDQRGRGGQTPTPAPLDELSFIYFVRTLSFESDSVERVTRHYNPARNPIALRALGRDTVQTNAGTFPTVVVEMRVKDPHRYGGEGVIRIHLSDDAFRYPVRIETSVPIFGATVLTLESYTRPSVRFVSGRD